MSKCKRFCIKVHDESWAFRYISRMQYWLMKSEPETYSIEDLERDRQTLWSGVRNYQARNFMSAMKAGDRILFYHSNAQPSGVAGTGVVQRTQLPDPTQFDKNSEYFDPKSCRETPRWTCAEVAFESRLPRLVSLEEIKTSRALAHLPLVQKGSRLSVHPVSAQDFAHILDMAMT